MNFFVAMLLFVGGWMIVGFFVLLLEILLFKYDDYSHWLSVHKNSDGGLEFEEGMLLLVALFWPFNFIWFVGKGISKLDLSSGKLFNWIYKNRINK